MTTESLVIALSALVGFLFGITARDAFELLRSSRKERKPMDRNASSRRVAVILVALVLIAQTATAVLLLVTRESTSKYAECVAHWQQDWAQAYKSRYTPAVKVSTAMDDVVKAVADKDPAKFEAAVEHYIQIRAQQNRSRAAHPLPPLPASVCGHPREASQ